MPGALTEIRHFLAMIVWFVVSLGGIFLLGFVYRDMFLLTIVFFTMAVAVWKAVAAETAEHGFDSRGSGALLGAVASLILYMALYFISLQAGAIDFLGPNPPAILIIFGVLIGSKGFYHELDKAWGGVSGGGGFGTIGKMLAIGLLGAFSFSVIFFVVLGGSWANAGELVGGAGYGVEQAVNTAGTVAAESWERFATSLSPQHNPNIARISCTFEAGLGGGVNPQQGAGSVAIQQCVRNKLGQNESTAESEKVTDPVEVQIQDIQVEPFPDHLRVILPVTNTLVYDLQGRAINVTARDVDVEADITYLGTPVASASRTGLRIPNGDTRTIEFNENGGGYEFPLFQYTTGELETDEAIKDEFETIKNDCEGDSWSDESGSCQDAVKYFVEGDNPSEFSFRSSKFKEKRIAFLVKTTDNFNISEFEYVDTFVSSHMSDDLIAPGYEYEIDVTTNYTYSAEAAFTESSRWRSGNHLLKIWNPDAWNELSYDERQSWESQNCHTVTRYGQEFTKQRTAALTTPIVPVMYTDCSSPLFTLLSQSGNAYEGDIEINIGATVQGDTIDQDYPVEVTDATTTCTGTGSEVSVLSDSASGVTNGMTDTIEHQEGAGWSVDPGIVERNVRVEGERQTIGCSVDMEFDITVDGGTSYEVPAFEYE